jgi:hypothetical protein
LFACWSGSGLELFCEAADNRIMVADYTVDGSSFVPGKRFVAFTLPQAAPGEKGSVHVTMLLNFFDELSRRIP